MLFTNLRSSSFPASQQPLGPAGAPARVRSPGDHIRTLRRLTGTGLVLLAGILLLSACTNFAEIEDAKKTADEVSEQITPWLAQLPSTTPAYRVIEIEEGPWTGLKLRKTVRGDNLPERFRRDDGVTLPLGGPLTRGDMAQRISAATGLGVHFLGTPLKQQDDTGFKARLIGNTSPSGEGIWQGSLADLLDEWVAIYGYDWRYNADRERLEIIRAAASVFEIHALGGTQEYTTSSSTSDRAEGGGEQNSVNFSTQTLETRYTYDPWERIRRQLAVIVSENTGVEVAPESGTVIVRGLPRDITAVRHYFRHLNQTILRPINVTVRLLYVSWNKGLNYSNDLIGSVGKILGQNFGLTVAGQGAASAIALVKPSPLGGDTAELTINALRQLGTVSRVLSAGVPSLPGKPAQYYELFRDTYLASVSTDATDGAVATELTPGSVSSGFSFSYTGQITGPDRALLRLAISLQDRPEFEIFSSGGNVIQLPEFASRGINVTQMIRARETLIIAGFSERSTDSDQSGQFVADNPVLGSRQNGGEQSSEIVLLLNLELGDSFGLTETREVLL